MDDAIGAARRGLACAASDGILVDSCCDLWSRGLGLGAPQLL